MPKWHIASSSCQVLRPVRRLARHGLHLGLFVKPFENSTPSRATRSKAGVLIHLQPYAPACPCDQSSAIAKRMLGRLAAPGWAARPAPDARKRKRQGHADAR